MQTITAPYAEQDAGVAVRALAYMVDFATFWGILLIEAVVQDTLGVHIEEWLLDAGLAGLLLAFGLAEGSPWQGTPGKKLLGLRVVSWQGERISYARSLWRALMKAVSLVVLGMGFLGPLVGRMTFHDGRARTRVIKT